MKKIVMGGLMLVMTTGAVFAQTYDIKEMTPAVKAALAARKDRFGELKEQKTGGLVGETNHGYVAALGGGAEVKALVVAENRDRKAIYEAIVEQNDLGSGALETVEKVFAAVQRGKADRGEKVQDESGNW